MQFFAVAEELQQQQQQQQQQQYWQLGSNLGSPNDTTGTQCQFQLQQQQQQQQQPEQQPQELIVPQQLSTVERNLALAAWLEVENKAGWVKPFWSIVGEDSSDVGDVFNGMDLEDLQAIFGNMPQAKWIPNGHAEVDLGTLFAAMGTGLDS